MNIISEIKHFLETEYSNESLAYLGLTTKIENPFRDKFAYFLHKKYQNQARVSREFSDGRNLRVDLAILTENEKHFIEFKACYAFDLVKKDYDLYKKEIIKDFEKYSDENISSLTFVLLSIRISDIPDFEKYLHVVKYISSQRASLKKCKSTENQKKLSDATIEHWFDGGCGLYLVDNHTKKLGDCFGVTVYLDYYIIKPDLGRMEKTDHADPSIGHRKVSPKVIFC